MIIKVLYAFKKLEEIFTWNINELLICVKLEFERHIEEKKPTVKAVMIVNCA